jgi:hydrogenase maturation protein HypF
VTVAPVNAPPELVACRLRVTGLVQGVGFRPFVHRLATRCGLAGWVRNTSGEVEIVVEGAGEAVERFVADLSVAAPPLAAIDAVARAPVSPTGRIGFAIARSGIRADRRQPVSPDVAICAACEAELHDPANRRYRYPFITCTDCGPRFTVIEEMPYDRERTSMRVFPPCSACAAEYHDPADRRYHSETNSCPSCGPRVWLEDKRGTRVAGGDDAIRAAGDRLRLGEIVAVRGLGGFHLAADATNDGGVRRLRALKHREAKPLAVMVPSAHDARRLAEVESTAAALLASRERPIVLVRKKPAGPLAESVAPGLAHVGVVVAYTPLHLLLLEAAAVPLVMTSGNRSDEPIATGLTEARERLGGIADAFVMHDREIVARYDDSVVRPTGRTTILLRRARGYAPMPLRLPVASPAPLVAVGPHLKNTFTLAHGHDAYVSQHIGDLDTLETLEHFRAALGRLSALFHIEPEAVVHDLHPGYLSTRLAADLGLRAIGVQHHVAHIAAVAAEHGVTTPVIGVAFDGTGYGLDGHMWGAEVFVADLATARRVGQLRYAPMPGGDRAARSPWRCALAYRSLEQANPPVFAAAFATVSEHERSIAQRQLERHVNSFFTSSMGRLFDAAAAILGVRTEARYEGQAAMELEALAGEGRADPLPFPLSEDDGRLILEPLPLLVALDDRRLAGDDVATLAARFHESVAAATAALVERVAGATGVGTVALGGGAFQNARLLHGVWRRLERIGLRVLLPRVLSPNDGAISFGQAALGAAQLQRERGT